MNISSSIQPKPPVAPQRKSKVPEGATVTHDAETDCFHYDAPGHHYETCRLNPFLEGAKVAGVVAVPAFLGALQNDVFGTLGAGLGGTISGVAGGAVLGGAIGGYKSYKGSNDNPLFGALGGLAGAAGGAVLFPILKQPGLWGGVTGAAVATGIAGLGAGIWAAVHNSKVTEEAMAHGWKP